MKQREENSNVLLYIIVLMFVNLLSPINLLAQNVKLKDKTTSALFVKYLEDEDSLIGQKIINSNDTVYAMYCKAKIASNDIEKIYLFSKFIDHNPIIGLANAYLWRGQTYIENNKYDSSLADLNKSIELNPTIKATYKYRGVLYYYLKKYNNALLDLNQAIQMDTNYYDAYIIRVSVYYYMGAYSKSIQDCNKLIKHNKNDGGAYCLRGMSKEELGDLDGACSDFQTSFNLGFEISKGLLEGYCSEVIEKNIKNDCKTLIINEKSCKFCLNLTEYIEFQKIIGSISPIKSNFNQLKKTWQGTYLFSNGSLIVQFENCSRRNNSFSITPDLCGALIAFYFTPNSDQKNK